MMSAPFTNVSGGDLDIQDISCKNGTKDPVNDSFKMWWYDTTAKRYVYATYTKEAWADDGVDDDTGTCYTDRFYWASDDDYIFIYAPLGWKHDASAPATIRDHEKTFKAGEGFWIQSSSTTPIVTVAGAVVNPGISEEFATVTLTKSTKQMVTNPFPVGDYDIQDISCKNGTKDPVNDSFKMWWYDTTAKRYIYATYTKEAWADDGVDDDTGTCYTDRFYWASDDDFIFIYAPSAGSTTPTPLRRSATTRRRSRRASRSSSSPAPRRRSCASRTRSTWLLRSN